MGEVYFDLALIDGYQPYKFSTHLTASTSLTFPRYLWMSVESASFLTFVIFPQPTVGKSGQ